MGLTVHYSLSSKAKTVDAAKNQIEKVRQLALDLPFEEVGNIEVIDDPKILNASVDDLRTIEDGRYLWLIEHRSVTLPWTKLIHYYGKDKGSCTSSSRSHDVNPSCVIVFDTLPSNGCETAEFGLSLYPKEVDVTYKPEEDKKYQRKYTNRHGGVEWAFNWSKFRDALGWERDASSYYETRKIKTRFGGWNRSGFCKTQYASEPECGGVANFLRGHIGLITLLERAAKIPGLKIDYNDEGKYGQSEYTDDWKVPNPVYYMHEGKYDPKALADEVGSWNEMIAGTVGALTDLFGRENSEAPIRSYDNFEHLEFKGSQSPDIKPFLEVMRKVAEQSKLWEAAK